MRHCLFRCGGFVILLASAAWTIGQEASRPVTVKFHEPKTDVTEATVPIDPTVRVIIQATGGMAYGLNAEGARLTFSAGSARTTFKIDEQIVHPAVGAPMKLPVKPPPAKTPFGYTSTFNAKGLNITQTLEAAPSRPDTPGEQRKLNTLLVRYLSENKDTQPHAIATRVRIDTYCRTTDGPLFAAPTLPNKILDGMEMKEKTLPPYVQVLERPDLKNPGFVAHVTLKFGTRMIGPDRFVCTAHFAQDQGWEVQIRQAGGDSDCVMYWNPRVIPPGGKIELAYAYGKGLATTPESEGRIRPVFGGSFEPNKMFTLAAYVDDQISNQSLELELPAGMELVEGKRVQPVPLPPPDSTTSLVLWKCRVKELGEHALRIRSSNGVTPTRTITIARP